jgi:hypothetical protein
LNGVTPLLLLAKNDRECALSDLSLAHGAIDPEI